MEISRARRMIVPLGVVVATLSAATARAGASAPPGSVSAMGATSNPGDNGVSLFYATP